MWGTCPVRGQAALQRLLLLLTPASPRRDLRPSQGPPGAHGPVSLSASTAESHGASFFPFCSGSSEFFTAADCVLYVVFSTTEVVALAKRRFSPLYFLVFSVPTFVAFVPC